MAWPPQPQHSVGAVAVVVDRRRQSRDPNLAMHQWLPEMGCWPAAAGDVADGSVKDAAKYGLQGLRAVVVWPRHLAKGWIVLLSQAKKIIKITINKSLN